jgi:hypothetical protein
MWKLTLGYSNKVLQVYKTKKKLITFSFIIDLLFATIGIAFNSH